MKVEGERVEGWMVESEPAIQKSPSMKRDLACHCGDSIFTLRLNVLEEGGVITCSRGHHSLLLDSCDYWGDVIQNGKPRELHCKCKSKTFTVSLFYTFRTDSPDVSQVDIITKCIKCGTERRAMAVEINYGPTDRLIDHPLNPCEKPWLKARQVKYSCLWEKKDLENFICQVMEIDIYAYLVTLNSIHPTTDKSELLDLLRNTPAWDLYLSVEGYPFPDEEVVTWKKKPVVHVWGPQVMVDNEGTSATMYFIEYAIDVIKGATIVPHPDKFLAFTKSMTSWLRNAYTSERGKRAFDNPIFYKKFRKWW